MDSYTKKPNIIIKCFTFENVSRETFSYNKIKIIFSFSIDKMKIMWYNIFTVKDMEKSLKPDWRKKNMKEKFIEIYNKNAEKMEISKAMYEIAVKQGNKDLARKYRKEYIEFKSEIDAYVLQLIK